MIKLANFPLYETVITPRNEGTIGHGRKNESPFVDREEPLLELLEMLYDNWALGNGILRVLARAKKEGRMFPVFLTSPGNSCVSVTF